MAKTRGETRAERLRQMEELYVVRGYTDAEMAERLDVKRQTVHEDRLSLMDKLGPESFEELERGRYKIRRGVHLSQVSLTLFNSLPLYLFARKSARQLGIAQPHVIESLEKLARCLRQPMAERLARSAESMLKQGDADRQTKVFEAVAVAWAEQKLLDIDYVALGRTREIRHTLKPFLIEPSVWSDAVYVVGLSDPDKRVMPFKLDRITHASVRSETFEIPDDFNEQDLLKHAWGIWTEEGQPQTVILRFSGSDVIRRLRETRWHPLEDGEQMTDGRWEWRAPVSQWREMLPWVRGWGADVEVVEPAEMKLELSRGVRELARLYGVAQVQSEDEQLTRLLRCWGKTGGGGEFHPALFHMLDVAQVASALLAETAPPRWRRTLAHVLNADEAHLQNWLPYFVALHDIGKISVPFQAQNAVQLERMKREGFKFEGWRTDDRIRHEIVSRVFLESADVPEQLRYLSEVISGHHGSFVGREKTKEARNLLRREHVSWQDLRQKGDALLRSTLLNRLPDASAKPQNVSTAIMALTGFMVLCDWVGSDARFFKPACGETWDGYIGESQRRAMQAAESAGLFAPIESDVSGTVEALFADLGNLRPLQLAVNDIPDDLLRTPTLTIIEAPTGEGKTEAALALARRIARINGTDELFYALPTMATSNQMFGRLQKHLDKRLKLDAHVKLAHGQAYLVEDELRAETALAGMDPLSNGDAADALREAHEAMVWFSGKKRALLAPFGVGTVDQIELAVLTVKHLALRMAGLMGKMVIVDEVHAYDTYMTTIVERLLRWLAQMGTSVILLSATLPLSRRERLLKAFGAVTSLSDKQAQAYPNLLVANAQAIHHASPAVWQPNRVITLDELHFGDADVEDKARWLLAQVADGGCACWMTNTVKRAQRIFAELRILAPADVRLDLLHSQMPLDERQHREGDLSTAYGRAKDTQPRPPKGIVVGTQVLEQSLDLDFDVMVSDFAPIDLLLQRVGRLHRHDRARPAAHAVPRLFLNFSIDAAGNLRLGSDRTIYAQFIMRKTHLVLAGKADGRITLPADYRTLIEAVYGSATPAKDDALYDDWLDLEAKEDKAKAEANERLIPFPHERDSFAETIAQRRALLESENKAGYLVAQTRLGEPSLNVIPLERRGDTVHLAAEAIPVIAEAPRATQLRLLRRHLRISNPDAIDAIEAASSAKPTKLFKQSALLEDFYPLWLTQGRALLQIKDGKTLVFTLDSDLGLVIEKLEKDKTDDTDE